MMQVLLFLKKNNFVVGYYKEVLVEGSTLQLDTHYPANNKVSN